VTEPIGRRERKKAATRQKIADAALRLFRERGFDAVGIRDVAAEADVAVTTVFSHFASKEALVFDQDRDFEQGLVRAVSERAPQEGLVSALHRELRAQVRHCTSDDARPAGSIIEASPALQEYEKAMRLRHADSLAAAVAGELGLAEPSTACRALARFVVDAFQLAREAPDPDAALDEVFRMIESAWAAQAAAREPIGRRRSAASSSAGGR
jgi:AcrR family transcriptional regulator